MGARCDCDTLSSSKSSAEIRSLPSGPVRDGTFCLLGFGRPSMMVGRHAYPELWLIRMTWTSRQVLQSDVRHVEHTP